MYLYFNNLIELPNFGCRTTGLALKSLIRINFEVESFDAMESVNFSGWDSYARGPLKQGGLIPRKIYNYAWKIRKLMPRLFNAVSHIDKISGGKHDYIHKNPNESLKWYKVFKKNNPRISNLENEIEKSDGLIINGEGTLIFGNPTFRDALYLLFLIALAKEKNKPVFLLNAMVTACPYNGEDAEVLQHALPLLSYCKIIALRESRSYNYVASKIGASNLEIIPDALFSWGKEIRKAASIMRSAPMIGASHPTSEDYSLHSFEEPYICISGSSSAWRHEPHIRQQFKNLILEIKKLGYPIYCIETCDGDHFLDQVAKTCGVKFIPKNTPALAAAGIIAGALIYITGRYHPSIMASASGTPCIFLSSNSHKTSSIQDLLGYEDRIEYPVCPNDQDIKRISTHAVNLIAHRDEISKKILERFHIQSDRTLRYASLLDKRIRNA